MQRWRSLGVKILLISCGIIVTFNFSLWGRLQHTRQIAPHPEAILVLGGDFDREYFAAYFAQAHPHLNVFISSGMPETQSRSYFAQVGVDLNRVHYDRRAVDTVTNFTTMVEALRSRHLRHVYLITSDFHMSRAQVLAYLIFGRYGIAITPITVPTQTPPEPWWAIVRDGGRGVLWILTGHTVEKIQG